MELFDIEEIATPSSCATEEPDGCEICGHCRLLRMLLLEKTGTGSKRAADEHLALRDHPSQWKEQ